ncbi:hypothetical protein ACWDV4_28725 [Micromonospora sp. NPDC003197]
MRLIVTLSFGTLERTFTVTVASPPARIVTEPGDTLISAADAGVAGRASRALAASAKTTPARFVQALRCVVTSTAFRAGLPATLCGRQASPYEYTVGNYALSDRIGATQGQRGIPHLSVVTSRCVLSAQKLLAGTTGDGGPRRWSYAGT